VLEAVKAVRHGAALMSAEQVAGIQALFQGDAWQHMNDPVAARDRQAAGRRGRSVRVCSMR
jgi:hypothetical protein